MKTERIDRIEEYVIRNKSVSLDRLCEEFGVSKNTIRRDIEILLQRGSIRKVYGGVTIADPTGSVFSLGLTSYTERSSKNAEEKNAICRRAAELVTSHDIIYIDTGTTCLGMVDYLSDRECTIITNSLQVSLRALPYPNLTVISLPGKLKRETLSFAGQEVTEYLAPFNISKAFMACTGLTLKNGLTNASFDEYIVKKAVLDRSARSYLLADHSKFGIASVMTYGQITRMSAVVTDRPVDPEFAQYFSQHEIGVILPEES